MKHIYVKLYFFTLLTLCFKTSKCACECCCCKKKQNTNSSNEIQLSNTNIDTKSNLITKNTTETNKDKNITETDKDKNINLRNNNKLNNKKNINENINSEDKNKINISKKPINNKTNLNTLKNNHTNVDINVSNKNNNTNNNSNNKSKKITNKYNNVNMNPPIMNPPIMMNNMNSMNNMNNFMNQNMNNMNPMMNNMNMNNINNMNNFMNMMNMDMNMNNNNNMNNIGNNNNKKEIEPIDTYENPTLIGLNNIGATCFMNSTLQCLSQTKMLTNYFLNQKNKDKIINNNVAKNNKNDNQLSPEYLELIQKLWNANNSKKSFSPNNFMQKINDMNPLFQKGQAGDAKDFIIFILEQLHRELKMPLDNKHLDKNIDNIPSNQYDKMNAFNHFFEEFKKETSILTDTFFGFNETTTVCLYCKNNFNSKGQQEPICYNYGIFNILIFPLDEVRKYRDQFYQANDANMVSLFDCFCYNQKSDYFTGDNKNFCNICRQLYDSVYTSRIFVPSNVLIMILNRGKGNIFKIKIDFSFQIDISDFVLQKDKKELYNLYGVITHIGESGPNAHFVASCKSPVDNNWYRYNDAFVDPIPNFQKDIYNFGNPYILFYEKQQ